MKVLQLSYHFACGGAAIAAARLHCGLNAQPGCRSEFLAVDNDGADGENLFTLPDALRRRCRHYARLEALAFRWRVDRRFAGSLGRGATGEAVLDAIAGHRPDIVNLHWINGGMLGADQLPRIGFPTVWTLHDSWAYCGAYHGHDRSDERYRTGYGRADSGWLEREVFRFKRRVWRDFRPVLAVPSRRFLHEVKDSILFGDCRAEWIPNGVDMELFAPVSRAEARERLGLKKEGRYLLFGAFNLNDDNKGGAELLRTLTHLNELLPGVELLTPGGGTAGALPQKLHAFGLVKEPERMALLYNAADALLLTSKAENLPNMLIEAAACGTPAAAFDIGGVSDAIEPGRNGELASPGDCGALAAGVVKLFERGDTLRDGARRLAGERFDLKLAARRYLELYRSLL